MKKYLFIFFLAMVFSGCSKPSEPRPIIAKVNNYELTAEEFEEAFRESSFALRDTPAARREFLENLINQKLILQDAQAQNFDKKKDFLKLIEKFWEQSLLKLSLEEKMKEFAVPALINDKAIHGAYDQLLKDGQTEKSYSELYPLLKWQLSKQKESQLMDRWIEELRKKAAININEKLLKKNQ